MSNLVLEMYREEGLTIHEIAVALKIGWEEIIPILEDAGYSKESLVLW